MLLIKAAALLLKDGSVISGKCHADCYKGTIRELVLNCTQGFITSEDKFVDRTEAGVIAFAAKQIKKDLEGSILMSEEIWSDGNCEWDDVAMSYKFKE